MFIIVKSLITLLPLLAIAAPVVAKVKEERPNFLFIMADDLGWGDVDFHEGKIPTPHLRRLRSEGAELTQHYVYPVCSPTRAALLSGRYASRFGVTTPQNLRVYPRNTVTIAKALKFTGYDTALCGKWHLGSKPEWGPNHFGFDHSYGSLAGGVGPWNHRYKEGEFTVTWQRNGRLIEEEGHVTDRITEEAIGWLKSRGEKPFFLYVPFSAVHIPIREPQEFLDKVPASITDPSEREYLACIVHLDDSVGKLLAALSATGKADNTLVVFTSDNGGVHTARNDDPNYPADNYTPGRAHGNNRPLRGQKGTVYEGGIRVPTIVRWPGHIKPGVLAEPIHITDWMPTFCSLAACEPDQNLRWDGRDLTPLLTGSGTIRARSIYVAGQDFRELALRDGDWKLVVHKPTKDAAPSKMELYHLSKDPHETTDRAATETEKVTSLLAKLKEAAMADRDAMAEE